MMTHYVYIPGFNDRFDFLRRLALLRWKSRTSNVSFVTMRWSNKTEGYEQKYARVHEAINRIHDGEIILVGESAGGAMALLGFAYNLESVSNVITICGYNHGSTDIHEAYRRNKPAFYDTSRDAETALETLSVDSRRRITTIYSLADRVVAPTHSRIDDAHQVILDTKGHLRSIIRVLLKGPNGDY